MSEHDQPTHVRYKVLGFMCVLAFLTYYDRFSIVRAQGEMQRDLGLDDAQLSWAIGAFFLAYALFEIPGGWLGDWFGARKSLVRIVLAWSLFTALTGTAGGFFSLLAFRFLFGAGEAGAFPNIARVQAAWLPLKARGYASGLIWLSARWGGALAPFIFGSIMRFFNSEGWHSFLAAIPGGQTLGDVASWRMSYWVAGLMGVVWVAAFFPFFRNHPSEKKTVNRAELDLIQAGGGGTPIRHEHVPGVWGMLLTSRSIWAISLLYFFASCGFSFFAAWLPRYLKDVHHLSFQQSEWMAAFPMMLGGLSCFVGGWLSDVVVRRTGWRKAGRAMFPVSGYIIAAGAMIAVIFVRTPEQATICLCVAMFAFDFGQGANWATIVDMGGRYAGIATGFLNMVGNMAGFIAPRVGAFVFNNYSWSVLFTLYAGAMLLAASMWLFIDPRRQFYDDRLTNGEAVPKETVETAPEL